MTLLREVSGVAWVLGVPCLCGPGISMSQKDPNDSYRYLFSVWSLNLADSLVSLPVILTSFTFEGPVVPFIPIT